MDHKDQGFILDLCNLLKEEHETNYHEFEPGHHDAEKCNVCILLGRARAYVKEQRQLQPH